MTVGGRFLKVPGQAYMEKIAVGAGIPADAIDLDLPPEEIVRRDWRGLRLETQSLLRGRPI